VLAAYEKAIPGLGRDIVKMAQAEQKHRHAWEMRSLWNDIFVQSGGLMLGLLALCFCISAAIISAKSGFSGLSYTFAGLSTVSVLKVFVDAYSRFRNRDRDSRGEED
jgi:uncharacterized membrane protein